MALLAGSAMLWLPLQPGDDEEKAAQLEPQPAKPQPADHANAGRQGAASPNTGAASSTRQALSPKDFWGSGHRLFELYEQGRQSTNEVDRYYAREAVLTCLPVVMRAPHPPRPTSSPQEEAELNAARAQLERLCQPFFSVTATELIADRRRLMASVQAAGEPVNTSGVSLPREPRPADTEAARSGLGKMLAAQGEDAMLWLASPLGGWIEHAAQHRADFPSLAPQLQDPTHLAMAADLSVCRLGFDCSSTGTAYLMMCTDSGQCHGSLEENFLQGLDADTRRRVLKQADFIAAAIKNRDLAALGL